MNHPSPSRYFLGSNSSRGFYSLYGDFCSYKDGCFLHVIKGGPGCGKSSFMRRIASAAEEKGLFVEYVLCSGDPDSIDGIYIPALSTGYVDGTAPHIVAASLVGWPSQNIVNDLGTQGICISAGSACHQGKPSHVVAALKLPKKVSGGVIRLSFGPETTQEEVDACVAALRSHHDSRMPML